MKNEYVIWGIPRGGSDEVLLLTSVPAGDGSRDPITEPDRANRLMRHLENVHGCTKCRVQEINLEDNKIQMI